MRIVIIQPRETPNVSWQISVSDRERTRFIISRHPIKVAELVKRAAAPKASFFCGRCRNGIHSAVFEVNVDFFHPTLERKTTMNYTILIYETAADFAVRNDPDKRQNYWAAWPLYSKALKDAGVFVGGAGLQPPETATTLKFSNEQRLVQDGPYADTKEQLGGFFMINVPNLDVALDWAARCPRMPGRVIEVRPNLLPMS